jgi:hypothetical protein
VIGASICIRNISVGYSSRACGVPMSLQIGEKGCKRLICCNFVRKLVSLYFGLS